MRSKEWIALVSCACIAFASACGGGVDSSSQTASEEEKNIPEGYTVVALDDMAGVNTFGVSVEFDPHVLSQNIQKAC